MSEAQAQTSEDRERRTAGINLELLKKCNLRFRQESGYNTAFSGTLDGEKVDIVMMSRTGGGTYSGSINGEEILPSVAHKLWDKFSPIARYLDIEEHEKASLAASRLLEM